MISIRSAAALIRSTRKQVFYLAASEFRKEAEYEQDFETFEQQGVIPPYVSAYLDILERRLGARGF